MLYCMVIYINKGVLIMNDALINCEVKKHSSAIQITNSISLWQRKTWNILLANAYEHLNDQEKFDIEIRDLTKTLEIDRRNIKTLKEMIVGIQSTSVQWNMLGADQKETWRSYNLLAEAEITGDILSYSYGPSLRKLLHNPQIYANISLSLQNKFNSKHSLALYELCVDFFNISTGHGETKFIPLDDLRSMFDTQNSYKEFKNFNQRLLQKAITEINNVSDIFVTPRYNRTKRKVSHIKFIIKVNEKNIRKRPENEKDDRTIDLEETAMNNFEQKSDKGDSNGELNALDSLLSLVPDIEKENINIQTTLVKALEKYDFERVKRSIEYTNGKNYDTYGSYLFDTIKNDTAMVETINKKRKKKKKDSDKKVSKKRQMSFLEDQYAKLDEKQKEENNSAEKGKKIFKSLSAKEQNDLLRSASKGIRSLAAKYKNDPIKRDGAMTSLYVEIAKKYN